MLPFRLLLHAIWRNYGTISSHICGKLSQPFNRNQPINRAPQQRPPQQRPPQQRPGGGQNPPNGPPKGPDHRAFKLTDFEMPWTIMKVGFRYHTTLGQLEKVFFYLFRFGITIIWGMSIYGSATGDSGGDGAFSPEDQKLWECDTKKTVCSVICFNRFQFAVWSLICFYYPTT